MGVIDRLRGAHRRLDYHDITFMVAVGCGLIAGIALSRLLFEGLFPAGGWLGRPAGIIILGLIAAAGSATVVWGWGKFVDWGPVRPVAFLPLLLNLVWLIDPAVDLARGRFLFSASVWLVAVLLVWMALGDNDRRWRWLGPLFIALGLLPVYLLAMSHAVGAADTFEFQVVASQMGIAHPTGYPLYLLLGKLFSLLPAGTIAWRLNLASAVYAVLAAAVVFRVGLELVRRPLPALVGAVALGLVPVFWGQAIIAEVYTLHALIVAIAVWLMMRLTANREYKNGYSDVVQLSAAESRKTMVALAFVLGLGLANHLTTLFLLPPAAIAIVFNLWPVVIGQRAGGRFSRRRSFALLLLQLAIAFSLPLLLYAYLPLRWEVVNGEPMGFGRFVEWLIGGRFQGALQWGAWLRDPARRSIVSHLLLDAWNWFYLIVAAVGLVWLFARQWQAALVLLVAAAGFTFYALNYYVPDLAVFLIPTHVVIAVGVVAGVAAVDWIFRKRETIEYTDSNIETGFFRRNWVSIRALIFLVALIPALTAASGRGSAMDQSGRDGGETWAQGVLAQPLARGAAVLADSEKIAPLYYLQQVEGLRPDLDIMVLPDEAAYRTELETKLATGWAVYLARYLPGLEGIYHLRSVGPLVEVSQEPLEELPADVVPAEQVIGSLRLKGYTVNPVADVGTNEVALQLYWALVRPLRDGERTPVLYLRWAKDGAAAGEPVVAGPHPVSDTYPVNAWRMGEIVADYHTLPLPNIRCERADCDLEIEVAVAPRFTPAVDLEWQPIAAVPVAPLSGPVGEPRRAYFDGFALDGIDFPSVARPGTPLQLHYSGYGDGEQLTFVLVPPHAVNSLIIPTDRAPNRSATSTESSAFSTEVEPATEARPHVLIAYTTGEAGVVCGWAAQPATGCVVAEIEVSGAPLPKGATNFADKIALLDATLDLGSLTPGGQLPLTLTWQALAEMSEDYTVFVQVLDEADRIVGQVDAWPVQGTRPTSSWRLGETIVDPYIVQLDPEMPPGDYRLHVGFYLLSTGQRLPVVDEAGNAVDDKVEIAIGE